LPPPSRFKPAIFKQNTENSAFISDDALAELAPQNGLNLTAKKQYGKNRYFFLTISKK
jgi:hypothetical protein